MRRSDRLAHEARGRELERLKACLREIVWRCRGKAVGLASQALHSDYWPDAAGPQRKD